jgi:hypothetical protein
MILITTGTFFKQRHMARVDLPLPKNWPKVESRRKKKDELRFFDEKQDSGHHSWKKQLSVWKQHCQKFQIKLSQLKFEQKSMTIRI